jgi:hypothetical protein
MAAGLGFKTFNTGDVLSAADVNGYLMQGVLVFASTAARDSAITAPAEGQFAFTKDTNSLFYYDGAAWVASGATGDIEGVTAGTGISGGGTSGTVTITNSMATAIDAKGDLIVGTGADTFSRLAAGTNTYVLTANSAEATGLKWVAPAAGGGGKVLQVVSATTTTATTIATTTFTDTTITATITPTSATSTIMVLVQGKIYAERASGQCFYSARLLRDATTIHNLPSAGSFNFGTSSATIQNLFPINWVDSPATTSATTYKVQGAVQSTSSGATTTWQNSGGDATSTIILLEIGA